MLKTFWPLLAAVLISEAVAAPVIILADAATQQAAEAAGSDYGRVRLFGAVGLGAFSPLNGLLVTRFGNGAGFLAGAAAWLSASCLTAMLPVAGLSAAAARGQRPAGRRAASEVEGSSCCGGHLPLPAPAVVLGEKEMSEVEEDEEEEAEEGEEEEEEAEEEEEVDEEKQGRRAIASGSSGSPSTLIVEVEAAAAAAAGGRGTGAGEATAAAAAASQPPTAQQQQPAPPLLPLPARFGGAATTLARLSSYGGGTGGGLEAGNRTATSSAAAAALGPSSSPPPPSPPPPLPNALVISEAFAGRSESGDGQGHGGRRSRGSPPPAPFSVSTSASSSSTRSLSPGVVVAASGKGGGGEGTILSSSTAPAATLPSLPPAKRRTSSSANVVGDGALDDSALDASTLPLHRKIAAVFGSPRAAPFFATAWSLGYGAGTIDSWLFVFMEEPPLRASKQLMGVTILVTCATEVPAFFFAGRLIERLGSGRVLAVVALVLAARLAGYCALPSITHNPWAFLPLETLNGVTFGCGWAAVTARAAQLAPPGLAATAQAAFAAVYGGLGAGLGSLAGGVVRSKAGRARWVFAAAAGVIALAWAATTVAEALAKAARRRRRGARRRSRAAGGVAVKRKGFPFQRCPPSPLSSLSVDNEGNRKIGALAA